MISFTRLNSKMIKRSFNWSLRLRFKIINSIKLRNYILILIFVSLLILKSRKFLKFFMLWIIFGLFNWLFLSFYFETLLIFIFFIFKNILFQNYYFPVQFFLFYIYFFQLTLCFNLFFVFIHLLLFHSLSSYLSIIFI